MITNLPNIGLTSLIFGKSSNQSHFKIARGKILNEKSRGKSR